MVLISISRVVFPEIRRLFELCVLFVDCNLCLRIFVTHSFSFETVLQREVPDIHSRFTDSEYGIFTWSMATLVSEGTIEKILIHIPLNIPCILYIFPYSKYRIFTRSMAMLVLEGTPEKIMIYIPLNVPDIHLFP